MIKMFHPRVLVIAVAWLTIMILAAINALKPLLSDWGLSSGPSAAVAVVQFIFMLLIVTPLWRCAWRYFPKLNDWVYPDLNGEWDVEVQSNWPRIDAMVRAANNEAPTINVRTGPEQALPPLGLFMMRARITQSWLKMKVVLWNPAGTSPIKESVTTLLEPFRGSEGRHGLGYIFEQENETDVISDDTHFHGAARIVRDRDNPNVLCGRMWSDRMWRRGMNTAANLKFTRR